MRDHRNNRVFKHKFPWRMPSQAPDAFVQRTMRWYVLHMLWFVPTVAALTVIAYAVAWLTVFAALAPSGTGLSPMLFMLVLTVLSGLALLVGLALWKTGWSLFLCARWADMIAATGRCAACGYDLAAIAPEADGLRVCPECGGAWRVGQTASPAPSAQQSVEAARVSDTR